MKPKHTKGPWKLRAALSGVDYVVLDAQKQIVAKVLLNPEDAKLIAAAPEMYELLHAIWAKTDPSKDPKTCRAIANLLDQVDETIKARGES